MPILNPLKRRRWQVAVALTLALAVYWWKPWDTPPPLDHSGPLAGWAEWGNDPGGQRFSPLTQINPGNVRFLKVAWEHWNV